MKAIVTGATGFIGSHLVDELLNKGFEIICFVRKTSNLKWLKNKPVMLVEASLYEEESFIPYLKDADYIYHVAGVTFAKNKSEFYHGNVTATTNLVRATELYATNLKRFVYISSQTVSGPALHLDSPLDEMSVCKPITTYGRSKKSAEDEVVKYIDKFPITILRASAVYGPRDTAILSIFKSVKLGIATIVGLKPKYLNLIHSQDLVQGIIKASLSEKAIGEAYFLASEEIYTWNLLIPLIAEKLAKKHYLTIRFPHWLVLFTAGISELINKFSQKPSVFNYEKGIDFIQNYWICSVEKAKNDFDFKQTISIEKGISDTIAWYKSEEWL